jgi:DMSO/TMAO reductase YedYZ molybdopterin-dependent catalytic subunit/thiosulfate reductase cytochrome b subunit
MRLMHWVNFFALALLLMSGLQIFNAHPALYWGNASHFTQAQFFGTPILSMYAERGTFGQLKGITQIGGDKFDTSGWFGLSNGANGQAQFRAFPYWATLPGHQWLAMGRHWHFFFAWILVINAAIFFLYALFSGHLKRDLLPSWKELRGVGRSLGWHLLLRFPKDETALDYNVVQKLAYLVVIFGFGSLMVATGLTLSPSVDAIAPQLVTVFGGRQSARTLHFIFAFSLLGFFVVHMLMVLVSGVLNNLRAITTGYMRIESEQKTSEAGEGPSSRGRRNLLMAGTGAVGVFVLVGSRWLSGTEWFPEVLHGGTYLTRQAQYWLTSPQTMATEYSKADIAPVFRPNGTKHPQTSAYQQLAKNGFKTYELAVGGLVEKPLKLSLAQLHKMPSRTQITRHDCVEGWSCIGQWTGVRLATVLEMARPKDNANYVVFFCADKLGHNAGMSGGDTKSGSKSAHYYESINMAQAYHPQTLLAYGLNGQRLPIPNGAPLRLRLPLQLGYKMAKYVMRIEVVNSFDEIAGGQGGFWEDRGYDWYAGV